MFLAKQAGNDAVAKEAAALIVRNAERIGATRLVATVKRILGQSGDGLVGPAENFVREARKLLAIDFRNPILLVDVARELTAKGHHGSALRYVNAAVALAPNSRFVVRAVARYFLHVGDHERAHEVLKRSALVASDPWVQASEIAVATLRGRASSQLKQATQRLSNAQVIGTHMSELASAVATVELQAGAEKRAKQLFKKAITHPTDNSLAQVEWAATRLNLVVDEIALRTPLSFEANSNNAYRKLMIGDAVEFAKKWSADEPFAARPLDTMCYLYSLQGRFEEAYKSAQEAIRIDGTDLVGLQMNLLFTRIQIGEVDQAHEDIIRLARRPEAKQYTTHLLANAGALAYATGDFPIGRAFYQRAIQAARARSNAPEEALARAFFAKNATVYGDPAAVSIVNDASTAVARLPSPGATYVLRNLVDAEVRKQLELAADRRVAKRQWEWDAATNTLKSLE